LLQRTGAATGVGTYLFWPLRTPFSAARWARHSQLVGRSEEIDFGCAALSDPRQHGGVISEPGGVGKDTSCREVLDATQETGRTTVGTTASIALRSTRFGAFAHLTGDRSPRGAENRLALMRGVARENDVGADGTRSVGVVHPPDEQQSRVGATHLGPTTPRNLP